MASIATIRQRHSVREYVNTPIEGAPRAALLALIEEAREATGLDIQFVEDNPEVFAVAASFGLIHGCSNTIVIPKRDDAQEPAMGYWGQNIVLGAQELGLRTCWCGIFSRRNSHAVLREGERHRVVIAVGYGANDGVERATKPIGELSSVECSTAPAWFAAAMEAAQLAPTALNAQNFHITLLEDGRTVRAEAAKRGYRRIDLGIVMRNFEVAANELGADWRWDKETAALLGARMAQLHRD